MFFHPNGRVSWCEASQYNDRPPIYAPKGNKLLSRVTNLPAAVIIMVVICQKQAIKWSDV